MLPSPIGRSLPDQERSGAIVGTLEAQTRKGQGER